MTDLAPVPSKEPSPLTGLSRQELTTCALAWLDKAKQKHQEARRWEERARSAEARLEMYDARERATTQGDR